MSTVIDPPDALLANLRNMETVIFVGAGFSVGAGLPGAGRLARTLDEKLPERDRKSHAHQGVAGRLDIVAERFQQRYGRRRLVAELEPMLTTGRQSLPSAGHQLLALLVKHGFVKTLVTTNFDTLIEDACAFVGAPVTVIEHDSQIQSAAGDNPILFKIHGGFPHPELLILTQTDMQRWNQLPTVRRIITQVQAAFDRNALLFIGSSLSDFDVLALLLGAEFSTRGAPTHKRLAAIYPYELATSDGLRDAAERLKPYAIDVFSCEDTEDLLRWLLRKLPVRLRVRHLLFNYPSWYPGEPNRYGGIETFIEYLAKYPGDIVYQASSVFATNMLGANPGRHGATTYAAYPGSFFFLRAAARVALEAILEERRTRAKDSPDVVHIHFLPFATMFEEAGIPVVCTSHSLLSTDLSYATGVFDGNADPGANSEVAAAVEAERVATRAARYLTVLSSAHESEVRGLGARAVRRVDAPFDARQFRGDEEPRSARARADIPQLFTIGYVGRPDRRKGIEVLLDACEIVASHDHRFQILIVGHGFQRLEGKIEIGMRNYWLDISSLEARGVQVILRGAASAASAAVFYAAAEVVVVPSLYEPMGYVVLEAMACARPVVASRVGGMTETIEDGTNGRLFNPGDARDLAGILEELVLDGDVRARLGQRARDDMLARPAVANIARQWEEMYHEAAYAIDGACYPPAEVLDLVRSKCDEVVQHHVHGTYELAKAGCFIAGEIQAEHGNELRPREGTVVDSALLGAVARALRRSCIKRNISAPFSARGLAEIMSDLTSAQLHSQNAFPRVQLRASDTQRRMRR